MVERRLTLNLGAPGISEDRIPTAVVNAAVDYLTETNPFFVTPSEFSPDKLFNEFEKQLQEAHSETALPEPVMDSTRVPVHGSYLYGTDTRAVPETLAPLTVSASASALSDCTSPTDTMDIFSDTQSFFGDSYGLPSPSDQRETVRSRRPRRGELTPEEKRERRRAQNRAAASKCRRKKMDRFSQLKELTDGLEDTNRALHSEVQKLQDMLAGLREEVLAHKACMAPRTATIPTITVGQA
eukprot:comp8771_c0_seq1/m.3999 comp8771_c0_seq1/g.3999  ORF comp8771_c0_seq1/g.3999 comp8771_c0_seq1/m.3999 type:complete len:240 (-) comp8771_c0_seq1:398-1117(-)